MIKNSIKLSILCTIAISLILNSCEQKSDGTSSLEGQKQQTTLEEIPVDRNQYWHGNKDGIKWYPNGKNITFTEPDPKVHPKLTAHSNKMDQGIFVIGKSTYMAYGYALTSPVMIVGDDGVLIIDPPEDVDKAKETMVEFRKYTDKPIKAIMYSHWHPDHYAGVKGYVTDEEVASGKVQIIAHKTFMQNVIASSSGGDGPIIGARVDYSLGTLLDIEPDGRINGGLGPDFEAITISLIPPTVLIDQEKDMTIAGINVHFEWIPSEASDEIIAWFPDNKVLHAAEVIQGESFPNLHSIRGTKYREPERWFQQMSKMLRFPAEFMVTSHGRPVAGKQEVYNTIEIYRDAIQFVFDQTIRFMNKGYLPYELVEAVQLPEHMANHPWLGDFYGGVKHSVRQIYVGQLGWFEGDPTFLDPINRVEASKRYVELMGGRDKVIENAKQSRLKGDNQWSAELLTHIIRIDNNDTEARNIKAEDLRLIGYNMTNNNWRNWYMTSALELEGNLDYSKAIDLQAQDLVKVFPISNIFESLRFKIDGKRAAADDVNIAFGITVTGSKGGVYGLHIRNGVVAYSNKLPKNADILLTIEQSKLLGLITTESEGDKNGIKIITPIDKLINLIEGDEIILNKGSKEEIKRFFSYFDKPNNDPMSITIK